MDSQLPYDISIIGLGRVGLPLALCFADRGLRVLGVDKDPELLSSVRAGRMLRADQQRPDLPVIQPHRGAQHGRPRGAVADGHHLRRIRDPGGERPAAVGGRRRAGLRLRGRGDRARRRSGAATDSRT